MNYFLVRDGQQHGPYTLTDLQRYVAEGRIALADQVRGEGMDQTVTVNQVIEGWPGPPPLPVQGSFGQLPGFASVPEASQTNPWAIPPGLHWGIVLVLSLITLGLFTWIWMFVQASFVKKIGPTSKAKVFYAVALVSILGGGFVEGALETPGLDSGRGLAGLFQIAFTIVLLVGHFNLRSSLEEYYTQVENIRLSLSGVMTIFFNTVYFQYHFNRIRRWKETGVLS